MKIGIFVSDTGGERTGVEELQRRAQWVEENGFTSAWVPQIPWSLDALTALTLAATVTDRIELGTAVVPTYPRHPLALAQQALSVQAASGGRLTLGIGPSHPVVVENMHGLSYAKPYSHTVEYLEVLDARVRRSGPGALRGRRVPRQRAARRAGGHAGADADRRARAEDAAARREPHRGHDHLDGRRALDRGVRRAAARRRGDGGGAGDTAGGRRACRSPCATTPTRAVSARGAPVLRVRRDPHVPAHPRDRRRHRPRRGLRRRHRVAGADAARGVPRRRRHRPRGVDLRRRRRPHRVAAPHPRALRLPRPRAL